MRGDPTMPKEVVEGLSGICSEYEVYCQKKKEASETPMTFLSYVAGKYKKPVSSVQKRIA